MDVSHFVRHCIIPEEVWIDVSMDFITGLPNSHGYSAIFVVLYRLNKSAHFIPLKHLFDVVQIAQAYLDNVFKLWLA